MAADNTSGTAEADSGFLELESMDSMQRLGDARSAIFFEGGSTLVDLDGVSEQHAQDAADKHREEMAHGHHMSERYKVVSEIARGGMGAVLEVHDSDLDRRVAMKVLLRDTRRRESDSGSPMDTGPVNRFIGEAQLTGNLEHPNIVPVHELGLDSQGRVYFTMKRVKGRSLRQVMDKLRQGHAATLAEFSLGRLLSILLKVCDAIDFAHSRGIIHRDLKPENIMVGQFGEVLVMDWGLAKQLGEAEKPDTRLTESVRFTLDVSLGAADGDDSNETREGTVSGTPAYMAPEQARGIVKELSRHTDIFCLGGMLYEMLCLVPPFLAARMTEALEQARSHRLLPPKQKLDKVLADPQLKRAFGDAGIARARAHPKELVSIAMRAMAEDRMQRYPGVAEFKRDIENFLSAQPVSAHRDAPWVMLSKWARRNPTRAAVMTLAMFFLLVGGVVFAAVRAKTAADRYELSEKSRLAEEGKREETERRLKAERESRAKAEEARAKAEQIAKLEQQNREREQRDREAMIRRGEAFTLYSQGADLRGRASTFMDWRERAKLWRQAVGQFRQALDKDPDFVEAHVELANTYADLGFDDDALVHYQRADVLTARTTGRGHVEALMAYAMYDFQRKILREGLSGGLEEVFQRFGPVRDAAGPGTYYARIAQVLLDLGEAFRNADGVEFLRAKDLAADRLQAIEREGMPLWEVYSLLAFLEQGTGSNRARRDYLRRARELKPNLPLLVWVEVLHSGRSGSIMERRGIAAWDTFIEQFPYDPRGYYARASVRFSSETVRDKELEAADLRQAIELNPRYADAHKLLLRVYVRDGNQAEAIRHIDTMRRSHSGLDNSQINLIEAELTAATGEYSRLSAVVMASMLENPLDGVATLAQAVNVLLRDHEYEALVDICERVAQRMGDATPPAVMLFMGRALTMLARFDEALAVLRPLEDDPSRLARELRATMTGWIDDARAYPVMIGSLTSLPAPRRRFDIARILAVTGSEPNEWVGMFNTDGPNPSDALSFMTAGDSVLLARGHAMLSRRYTGTREKGLRALAVQELKSAFEEGYLNRARILGDEHLAPLTSDPELAPYFNVR